MRQGLQLKFSQQLTMTPQLQQAIKLLQLSTLELSQEITEQIYSNPLLEVDEGTGSQSNEDPEKSPSEYENTMTSGLNLDDNKNHNVAEDATEKPITENEAENDWLTEKPADLPVEANWEENFNTSSPTSNTSGEASWEQVYQVTESLQDHLLWQLNLTPFSLRDKQIAEAFIDSIENSGFINENLADILSHHEANTSDDPIEEDELLAVLHRLQQFDPPGVLARNVRECLSDSAVSVVDGHSFYRPSYKTHL